MKRLRIFEKIAQYIFYFFVLFDLAGFNIIFYDVLRFKFL